MSDKNEKHPLVESAKAYVRSRFNDELDPNFLFHNFAYSDAIASEAKELAEDTPDYAEEDLPLLKVTAYFFPLGYIETDKNAHVVSARMMREWLELQSNNADDGQQGGLTPEHIDRMESWLLSAAGKEPEKGPLSAQLLYDATQSWLGRKRYERRGELLRLERQARRAKGEIDPVDFNRELEERILEMDYLTDAGKRKYEKRRRKNVTEIHESTFKLEQKVIKQKSGKNYGRGIDTMYRTAFRNHINLSRIADGKANMMISINTIILSIIIAVSGAGLSFFEELFFSNPLMLLPIMVLLVSSLTAVIFAVFSARPKVTEYRIKKRKLLKSDEASLLYFGNFLKLEKKDFVKYMSEIKNDMDGLYDDLSRDLYDLGQVMHRKYLLLTISYNVFVGGLALSVFAFLVVYLFKVF